MIAEELSALLNTPLNPSRQNQSVRCPMHDDRVASLSISLPKGQWYCFGCGKGGGLQTLARFLGGDLDTTDLIVQTANPEPEPDPIDFREKYESMISLTALTPEGIQYAREKGLNYETLEYFQIRRDPRNLVMPYFDGDRVVALRYRAPNGQKWYEPGSERAIYNLNEVRGKQQVCLAEGESDTHTLWQALNGREIAVGGVPGANSSRDTWELWSLDLMWADKVYLAFDNDDAGRKGFERAKEVLGEKAIYLSPPEGFNDWSDAIKDGHRPSL